MRTDWYRKEFPVIEEQTYLNNAATVPMNLRGAQAVNEYMLDRQTLGAAATPKWNTRCKNVRDMLAELVGGASEDIVLTSGTSHGLSLIAGGFDWQEGDEVIITSPDFTANIYPWLHLQKHDVTVHMIERAPDGSFSTEDVAALITPKTRMVAITSVDFHSGFYADLTALGSFCRERGIVFGVDAIQSLGVVPLDVVSMNIDFLACGAHKWILGGHGGGFLYIAESLRPRVRPVLLGWNSVQDPEAYAVEHELREDAGKYQPGAPPYLVMAFMEAGLNMVLDLGVEQIHKRVLGLNNMIRDEVNALGWPVITSEQAKHQAGILTFQAPGTPEELFAQLTERGIAISVRRGSIRVSPHFYNNENDVERLLAELRHWDKSNR